MPSRISIFGDHDDRTVAQLERCAAAEDGARAVLCADGHLGYSMRIGVHCGSRVVGHKTATGFVRIASGGTFDAGAGRPGPFGPGAKSSGPGGAMESPPLLLPAAAPRGQD